MPSAGGMLQLRTSSRTSARHATMWEYVSKGQGPEGSSAVWQTLQYSSKMGSTSSNSGGDSGQAVGAGTAQLSSLSCEVLSCVGSPQASRKIKGHRALAGAALRKTTNMGTAFV